MLRTRILMGLDLGQQVDYTVLSIIEITHEGPKKDGFVYKLIFLHKFKLRVTYPEIVNWISTFIESSFTSSEYVLLVDYTGVGRPVVDMLSANDLNLIAVNISGGRHSNWKSGKEVSVTKRDIVTYLSIIYQEHRLKIPNDIKHAEEIKKEFVNFKREISWKDGKLKQEAASGYHDDIVMSIGLATWYGEYASRKRNKIRIISGS